MASSSQERLGARVDTQADGTYATIMACEPIHGLVFSEDSKRRLRQIKNAKDAFRLLKVVIPAGVFTTIFLGNKPLVAAFNISMTDWQTFGRAMGALNSIEAAVLQKHFEQGYFENCTSVFGTYDYNNCRFWTQLAQGCKR